MSILPSALRKHTGNFAQRKERITIMDNHRFQMAILASQDREREAQQRRGLIDGSGKRIFRIGRDRFETQPMGRR
jgi:hypothetical protein